MLMLPNDGLQIRICFGIAAFPADGEIRRISLHDGLFRLFRLSTGLSFVRGSGRGAGCCRWEAMTPACSSCTLHCAMTRGCHSTFGVQSTGLACLAYTSIPLAFGFTSLASCTGGATFLQVGCTFSICIQHCGEPPDILPVMLLTTVCGCLLCRPFWFFWWHGRSGEQARQITYYVPRSTVKFLWLQRWRESLSYPLTTSERCCEIR